MSFSGSSSARSPQLNTRRTSAPTGPAAAPGSGVRDGDTAYVEDSRKIGEAVRQIQQHTADIRRETNLLGTARGSSASQRVQESAKLAKATMLEAKRLLEGFPTGLGGSVSEQSHRRLTQQKLMENLMGASKALETAFRGFELAEAKLASERDQAAAAAVPVSRRPGSGGVEMHAMDGVADPGRPQQQVQDMDVTEGEVNLHAALVEEQAQEIEQISSSISALQRAMVDLAEHTRDQGVTLDVIEANMSSSTRATDGATEQLTHASRSHRSGARLVYGALLFAVLLLVALILILANRH